MQAQHTIIRRLRFVAVLVAVASALVVIATFGMKLVTSPWGLVNIVGPTAADSDGTMTAIIDSESRRMLILNEHNELTGLVDCGKLNSPIDAITDVCVVGDTIYVAGVQYQQDSDIIVRERVIAYNKHGSKEEVLYDLEVDGNWLPEMKSMDNAGDGVFVVLFHQDYANMRLSALKIVHVSRKGAEGVDATPMPMEYIYDIGYSSKANAIKSLNTLGTLNDMTTDSKESSPLHGHVFTSLDLADDGSIFLVDDTAEAVCRMDPEAIGPLTTIVSGSGYQNLHVNGDILTLCNLGRGTVSISKLDGSHLQELDAVPPTKALSYAWGAILACRVYLAAFLIVALILKIRALITAGSTKGFGAMFASAVIVGVVALAIGYLSYGSYTAMKTVRENEIDLFADYLYVISSDLANDIEACNDRQVFREGDKLTDEIVESFDSTATHVGGLAAVATGNSVGIYTTVYGKDDTGIFYLYESSSNHILGSSIEQSANTKEVEEIFSTGSASDQMSYGGTTRKSTMRRFVCVPSTDEERICAVIEIGSHLNSFEASVASTQVERTIALLVMMLVIYLTYVELRECARCFVSYGQLRHHHDAIAILTRPFSFLITLLSSIDAVMTTLIARSLLSAANLGSSSMLLALPSVMLGVGLALGQAIYALLGSRVVIQKLMVRGAFAMVCGAMIAFAVVWQQNYWLYCTAKLLMAIPFGLLYTLSYSLPRRADTDDVRAIAASDIKRTDTSAAALGTVLGGYAAQSLGNAFVYVLVALVGMIVLALAHRVLPQTNHPLEHEASATSRHEAVVKLLTSKTTLSIVLFLMLPAILASGYNSFLFPLFSANLGVSTSSINNLFVCGQLVVFVSISALERLEERYDKWRIATVAVALLGVVFLLFSFNTTLVWAVVTIALVGMLFKATDGWKALWPRSARALGLTTGLTTGVMFAMRSVLLIVQPLVLGTLLSLNSSIAVVVLGIVCSICSATFYLITRHTALAPEPLPTEHTAYGKTA
ncbi:MAG: MFS transporter [Atopobiaceae bacterium]|nr:MFS transporter [Atopobiaceae bacterium]